MFTIAIVNEKGGTGKTTTAVNLSAAMGELGRKVLLVDLDGQAASSRWLGVENDTSFADALYDGRGLVPLCDVIPNVSLAPASGKLDAVAHDLRPTQGGQLRKLLNEVAGGYEYCFIDCPPSLGNRLIGNALLAASHAIVPVETSILALDGLRILLTTLDDVREGFGHEIALAGVLACRFDARTRLSHMILAELNRAMPGKVFQTVIRENVRMRECPASGQSILQYAPESHAAEDYRQLAKELASSPRMTESCGDKLELDSADQTRRLGDMLRASVRHAAQEGIAEKDAEQLANRIEEAKRRLIADEPSIGSAADTATMQELPADGVPIANDEVPPALPRTDVPARPAADQPLPSILEIISLTQAEISPAGPATQTSEVSNTNAVDNEHSIGWDVQMTPLAEQPMADEEDTTIRQTSEPVASVQAGQAAKDNWLDKTADSVKAAATSPKLEDWRLDTAVPPTNSAQAECPNLRKMLEQIQWKDSAGGQTAPVGHVQKRGLLRRFFTGNK